MEHTVCCVSCAAEPTEGGSTWCETDVHGATEETLGLMKADITLFDTHAVASDPKRETDCHFKWLCLLSQQRGSPVAFIQSFFTH